MSMRRCTRSSADAASSCTGSGQRAPLLELGIHRLLCFVSVTPLVEPAYCPGDQGLVNWRTFAYGWHVHRLGRPAPGGG